MGVGMNSNSQKLIGSCCVDATGAVLAEARGRNVANAIRTAQWMLDHVQDATRAFVPRAQYEVCR